jgi:hypothetical protein
LAASRRSFAARPGRVGRRGFGGVATSSSIAASFARQSVTLRSRAR